MTQREAGRYAAMCRKAQSDAKKNGTEYIKPVRPDAGKLESMSTIVNHSKKDVKTLEIRMKVICEQMDLIVDYFDENAQINPEIREYQRIAGKRTLILIQRLAFFFLKLAGVADPDGSCRRLP